MNKRIKSRDKLKYFIGIDIPQYIKDEICVFRKKYFSNYNNCINWFGKYEFHMTLAYIGYITPTQRERLLTASDQVDFPKFTIDIAGMGFYPPGKKPKIIWVGVNRGREKINIFSQKVREIITQKSGLIPQDNFFPHVTIGKMKYNIIDERLYQLLQDNWDYPFGSFTVDSFHVYRIIKGGYTYNHEVKLNSSQSIDLSY